MASSARLNNENLFTFYEKLLITMKYYSQLNQFELTYIDEDLK
jgi:hypothetical protein